MEIIIYKVLCLANLCVAGWYLYRNNIDKATLFLVLYLAIRDWWVHA